MKARPTTDLPGYRDQRRLHALTEDQPAPTVPLTTTHPTATREPATLAAEQELIDALRSQDDTAYRMLVRRYIPLMLRVARQYVPNQAIAEEVVQDSWVAVLRGIYAFQGCCQFGTWLMRILLNTARKWGLREHTGALERAERAQHPCRTRARNAAEPGGWRAGRRDVRHPRATSMAGRLMRSAPRWRYLPATSACCCTGLGRQCGQRCTRAATISYQPEDPRLLLGGRMHHAVGTREHQALLAIVEANEEGRLTVGSTHFHHVTHAVGPAHYAAVHAQPVTDARSHDGSPRWLSINSVVDT